jgi:hypothetical protein
MKRKIIGILCMVLMITTAVLPVIATINEVKDRNLSSPQSSIVEWSQTYGGEEYERLFYVQQADDGGFIACGETEESDNYYPWVLKTDSTGVEEWSWSINEIDLEGSTYDIAQSTCTFILQTSDGGYLLCFGVTVFFNDVEYWINGLVKFDSSGDVEWIEEYNDGFDFGVAPVSLLEVEDGFIACGYAGNVDANPDNTMPQAALLKTDLMGGSQWFKEYDVGPNDDYLWGICKTNDGGYLLTGWAINQANVADYLMVKTNSDGDKEWSNTNGGDNYDFGQSRDCFQTSDGGYIMCGYSYSFGAGDADFLVVKTDSSGKMEWNKTFGGRQRDVGWSMESTSDGYVFCVTMNYDSRTGKQNIFLAKADENGNTHWQVDLEEQSQFGQSIQQTTDGGFIISGRTGPMGDETSDGLLVKVSTIENQRPTKPAKPSGPGKGEPDTEYTFTTSSSDPDGDQLQYMWDWGDGNYSDWLDTTEASHTFTTEDNFKIRVIAKDVNGGESEWSNPLHFSTPKNKKYIHTPFMKIFENQWNIFKIFRDLIGL